LSRPFIRSAVAIPLTRGPDGELLALVGRRNPKSRFLGGYFAFPGGVIEPEDGDPQREDESEVLRRTASRELEEETGLRVPAEDLLPAGWRVTPPFSPRRFDTKMYVAPVATPVEPSPAEPGELIDLQWARPADLVERWSRLEIRIAPPLLPMLRPLAEDAGGTPEELAVSLQEVNVERPEEGPRIEFVPDVHMVPLLTATLPPATHTNCYLVGARDLLIIDPGSASPDECARLAHQIDRRIEAGATPWGILVTHHHGDHTGGVSFLAGRYGVPVLAHPETWACGAGVPSGREIGDGEVLALSGGERLRVMHTPGHAAGHVALLEEGLGSLFAGDLVSGVSTVLFDGAPGSLDLYLESLARLRDSGARTLFPGHGPPLIAPARAIGRLLDHRADREGRILRAIGSGAGDLVAIVGEAYADTPAADPQLAARQTEAHLDRLERAERIVRAGHGWRLASG